MEGGAETQNEVSPHPLMVVNNWEGYLSCGGPLEEKGDATLHWDSPAQSSSTGKKSPHHFWLLNPEEIVTEREGGLHYSQAFLLQDPCMDLLTDRLAHSELQLWSSV